MIISNRTERLSMFVLAGWLFADLFIGLALLFMVGNTQPVPVVQPTPTSTSTPLPTPAPTPTPTPAPPPSIDPNDLYMQLTVGDPSAIINRDPASVQHLLDDINNHLAGNGDSGRRVGIVLVYSGTSDELSRAVAALLPSAGAGFKSAIFRQYFITYAPYTTLNLDIFFFR